MQHDTRESWHDKSITELTTQLRTNVLNGLTSQEAAVRQCRDGPNALRKAQTVSLLALLVGQFGSLVIWVLIRAALVSVASGEVVNGLAIVAIVVLNTAIGFFQEYRFCRRGVRGRDVAAPPTGSKYSEDVWRRALCPKSYWYH